MFPYPYAKATTSCSRRHRSIVGRPGSRRQIEDSEIRQRFSLTPEVITRVQARARERILRLFKRRELLSSEMVDTMSEWRHAGGFSLNADVTVPASDRAGLERLFRYCARPIFASERLQWSEKGQWMLAHLLIAGMRSLIKALFMNRNKQNRC